MQIVNGRVDVQVRSVVRQCHAESSSGSVGSGHLWRYMQMNDFQYNSTTDSHDCATRCGDRGKEKGYNGCTLV